jgi:hypothetical protein
MRKPEVRYDPLQKTVVIIDESGVPFVTCAASETGILRDWRRALLDHGYIAACDQITEILALPRRERV